MAVQAPKKPTLGPAQLFQALAALSFAPTDPDAAAAKAHVFSSWRVMDTAIGYEVPTAVNASAKARRRILAAVRR